VKTITLTDPVSYAFHCSYSDAAPGSHYGADKITTTLVAAE